jgi:hypothetical protein
LTIDVVVFVKMTSLQQLTQGTPEIGALDVDDPVAGEEVVKTHGGKGLPRLLRLDARQQD